MAKIIDPFDNQSDYPDDGEPEELGEVQPDFDALRDMAQGLMSSLGIDPESFADAFAPPQLAVYLKKPRKLDEKTVQAFGAEAFGEEFEYVGMKGDPAGVCVHLLYGLGHKLLVTNHVPGYEGNLPLEYEESPLRDEMDASRPWISVELLPDDEDMEGPELDEIGEAELLQTFNQAMSRIAAGEPGDPDERGEDTEDDSFLDEERAVARMLASFMTGEDIESLYVPSTESEYEYDPIMVEDLRGDDPFSVLEHELDDEDDEDEYDDDDDDDDEDDDDDNR